MKGVHVLYTDILFAVKALVCCDVLRTCTVANLNHIIIVIVLLRINEAKALCGH